jgi:hypothetical protein
MVEFEGVDPAVTPLLERVGREARLLPPLGREAPFLP